MITTVLLSGAPQVGIPTEGAVRRRIGLLWLVTSVVISGVAVLAAITILLNWMVGGNNPWSWHIIAQSEADPFELIRLALLMTGGIGGAVALTVAYRKQKWAEEDIAGKRSAYAAAATQLGNTSPTVRLAGVYALANLADDWPDQRQQCVDVLCGHLRVPWTTELHPGEDEGQRYSPAPPPTSTWGETQVRMTILTVIAAHLHPNKTLPAGTHSWSALHFNLTGALIPRWDLATCLFTGRLSAHNLQLVDGHRIDLTGANLTGADLTDVNLSGANLTSANLTRATLVNATMKGAIFYGTDLTDADLTDADLSQPSSTLMDVLVVTDLQWATLLRANLNGVNLTRANMRAANLTEAILDNANLTSAEMSKAQLIDARLNQAALIKANLINADLTGAFMFNADLTDADLSAANLTRTDLTGADLTGADFRGVELLKALNFDQARNQNLAKNLKT